MKKLKIDFGKKMARIKPLHGINNSPVTYGEALPELTAAGIPFVRTHDTAGAYGGTYFIDIPNIFPDFNADPSDPSAYDFAFTDAYLKGLKASGCDIFYRLGVTIENHYRIKAYRIQPPADFLKWAKICEGVIRHYNEGWNNGFHYGITYWEIWNEPENPPMWSGTPEEFLRFYGTVSKHLKFCFPKLKIGGYGHCGFYAITRENQTDFYKGFVTFFDDFLKYVTAPATRAPLDFFSWHHYSSGDALEIVAHAEYVDRKLKEYGLAETENIFDEWNYFDWTLPSQRVWDYAKEMPSAAYIAKVFCHMQNSPIDKALYYDALPTRSYCGLYYFPSLRVTKVYYAFKAFNQLYRFGDQTALCGVTRKDRFQAIAAGNEREGAILLVNWSPRSQEVRLEIENGASPSSSLLLDEKHDLVKVNVSKTGRIVLPPMSVQVVLCGASGAAGELKTVSAGREIVQAGLDGQ